MVNLPFQQEIDPVAYKIERRVLEDAPDITEADVISIAEAARVLGVSHSAINNLLVQERLTTVVDTKGRTAFLRPRRVILKVEIEQLKSELNLNFED